MSRAWGRAALAGAGALPLVLAACDNLAEQPRYDPYGEAKLFPDGKVLQAPPPGTMARDDPAWTQPLRERPPLTLALVQRGRDRFGIFCAPCHGFALSKRSPDLSSCAACQSQVEGSRALIPCAAPWPYQ